MSSAVRHRNEDVYREKKLTVSGEKRPKTRRDSPNVIFLNVAHISDFFAGSLIRP
jgi:hypothetical protein